MREIHQTPLPITYAKIYWMQETVNSYNIAVKFSSATDIYVRNWQFTFSSKKSTR